MGSYPEDRRTYPEGTVGAQVVGYAGVDDTGLGGLELNYNSELAGHPGSQTVLRDPSGATIEVLRSNPGVQGENVYSTIDHTIQAEAEQVLRKTVRTWGAKDGTAVVLDPRTGAVLAMAADAPCTTATTTPRKSHTGPYPGQTCGTAR